jgi:hypothetical protein
MSQATLFSSIFLAGFECSSHRRRDGRRLDLIEATGHDRLAPDDYRRCAAHGMTTIRDGLRWHLIEQERGKYDWSSWRPMLRAAREAGVRVIWDLFHYGSPDFLDVRSPDFPEAFAEFAATATRVHMEETDEPPLFCPVNEISFFAWAGGEVGYFPPFDVKKGDAFKRALVRAAVAAIRVVRTVEPRTQFLWAEPLIHVAPRHHGAAERRHAEAYRLSQFQAYDMLTGRLAPELGGRPDYVDAIGLNYYPHNQWYYRGPTIPMGHHEYRPMADMLVEVYQRYGKPLFIAETGAEGSGRPAWLHYVCDEVRTAMDHGAPVEGVCIYPITAYPGWDNDRPADTGLFSAPTPDGRRDVYAPLAEEIERQRRIFAARQVGRPPVTKALDAVERRFGT